MNKAELKATAIQTGYAIGSGFLIAWLLADVLAFAFGTPQVSNDMGITGLALLQALHMYEATDE